MTMKHTLDRRLDYLNEWTRRRVIDDVLQAFMVPTPFMIEYGARVLRRYSATNDEPFQQRATAVFQEMMREAQEGG